MPETSPAPGALIGYTKNGRPIRLAAGGSEDATPPAAPPATPPAPPAFVAPENVQTSSRDDNRPADDQPPPEAGPSTPAAPKPGPPPKPTPPPVADKPNTTAPGEDVESLQKRIKMLTAENAKNRIAAKEAAAQEARDQLAKDVLKALGIANEDDAPTDPAKLVEQLTAENKAKETAAAKAADELADLQKERQAERIARRLGADVDSLIDSRTFATALSKLDGAADDLAAQITALVEKTLADHPKYKAGGPVPPAPSGGQFTGGPGEQKDAEDMSVDEFRAAHRKRSGG